MALCNKVDGYKGMFCCHFSKGNNFCDFLFIPGQGSPLDTVLYIPDKVKTVSKGLPFLSLLSAVVLIGALRVNC